MIIDSTFSLLRFGIVLSLLVFVHELGHFLFAKWRGVAVEEFGFGLPPRVWGKKFRETVYSVNLFPVGGFVKLKGEDPEVAGFGDVDSFSVKSKKSRALMIVGGVLGNFLLAWLILSFLFAVGNPAVSGKVQVRAVSPGSPAQQAGLQAGDNIVSVDGKPVKLTEDLIFEIDQRAGRKVRLEVERQGQTLEMALVPRIEPPVGEGALGVTIALIDQKVDLVSYPLWQTPYHGLVEVLRVLGAMVSGLGLMVGRIVARGQVPTEVTGVVGIKALTDVAAALGERFFLQFVALLNLNLLIFNLLPIPALDGGRLLFVGIEALTRKKLPAKFERWANHLGLAFLLILFVLITIQDISRFR